MARPHIVDGEIVGVTVATLSLEWWTVQLARIPLPPRGTSSIVDRNGRYLARNPDGAPLTIGSPMPVANRFMLNGKEIGIRYIDGVTGDKRVAAWMSPEMVPEGLLVSVGLNVDHSFAEIATMNRTATHVLIAGALSALILSIAAAAG